MKTRTKEYVVLMVPEENWGTLRETLDLDARSGAFDPALRKDIQDSLASIETVGSTTRPTKLRNVVQEAKVLIPQ